MLLSLRFDRLSIQSVNERFTLFDRVIDGFNGEMLILGCHSGRSRCSRRLTHDVLQQGEVFFTF